MVLEADKCSNRDIEEALKKLKEDYDGKKRTIVLQSDRDAGREYSNEGNIPPS